MVNHVLLRPYLLLRADFKSNSPENDKIVCDRCSDHQIVQFGIHMSSIFHKFIFQKCYHLEMEIALGNSRSK